jgi:exonuclease SbcC
MVISEISIKGFKSFGNNEQTLKLNTESGELILLMGKNGNGKSSLIESFEYSLYGKVKSMKKKKWATLSTLPNRINGELLNRIKFQSNGTEVEVQRGISPNLLRLIENGLENDRAGKSNIDEKISNYIGMDIETFKSFISMSINDFKNFISLSTEEKQLLLDKLFNLEVINILNQILKDIQKQNKIQITKIDSEISTLDDSIQKIRFSIERSKEKEKENITTEIEDLTRLMSERKETYTDLKSKMEKIKSKDTQLKSDMDKEKEQLIKLNSEINSVIKNINLYDSGKCPTCGVDFDSDHFHNLRSVLEDKKSELLKIKSEIESNITSIKERQNKLQGISDDTTKSFNELTFQLRNYQNQIDKLKSKKDDNKSNDNVSEFEKTIIELDEKKVKTTENKVVCNEKELYYKGLAKVFGEDGVKKSIISGIIKPINHFIKENIRQMGLNFSVELDETFTAQIKSFNDLVDQDSLSTGENKKINIAILIAYLKLIRTKRHINILFLDEIFSSIDIEGCECILNLLKSFANEYNINIFVVHHAIMNKEYFDRIIRMEKDVFTKIEEQTINEE